MTDSEAMLQLKLDCASETHPRLTDFELVAVLNRYVLDEGDYDMEGVLRAAADAWALKTNKVTDYHSAPMNGRGFSAEQIKAHCEERERFYRRRLSVHVA